MCTSSASVSRAKADELQMGVFYFAQPHTCSNHDPTQMSKSIRHYLKIRRKWRQSFQFFTCSKKTGFFLVKTLYTNIS
jgi:hypothetical protein